MIFVVKKCKNLMALYGHKGSHSEKSKIAWKKQSEQAKEKYKQNLKYCKFCKKVLPYEKRMNECCDRTCARSLNNQGKCRNGKPLSSKYINCKTCGKKQKNGRSRGHERKFCDNTCGAEYNYIEYIKRWKAGLEDGIKGKYQTSNHIRRYLFEKYNSKCCKCGWNKISSYLKLPALQIEHIDGNCTNNLEENLELLCPNCHTLTPTYGSLNRGKSKRKTRHADII